MLSVGVASNFPASRRPTGARSPDKTGDNRSPNGSTARMRMVFRPRSRGSIRRIRAVSLGGDVSGHRIKRKPSEGTVGINVFIGSGVAWPTSYGHDTYRELRTACAAHMYYIGSDNVGTATTEAANSAGSVLRVAHSEPTCSKYLVGYDLGDEPPCTTTSHPGSGGPRWSHEKWTTRTSRGSREADCRANLNAAVHRLGGRLLHHESLGSLPETLAA